MKTSELIGPALDWAVAKCEGWSSWDEDGFFEFNGDHSYALFLHTYSPSANWSQGGPIIERESISIWPDEGMESWLAEVTFRQGIDTYEGPTPLIAAMRCYVASKLGDEVETPEELQ